MEYHYFPFWQFLFFCRVFSATLSSFFLWRSVLIAKVYEQKWTPLQSDIAAQNTYPSLNLFQCGHIFSLVFVIFFPFHFGSPLYPGWGWVHSSGEGCGIGGGGVGFREFSQPPWWLASARFHPLNGTLVCTRRGGRGNLGWDRTRLDARTSDLWPRVAEVRSTPLKARCWEHYPHHPIVMMILKRPCSSLCWSRRYRVLLPSLIPPAFSSTHR